MKKFLNKNLLLIIILLSAILRLLFLDLFPPHLRNDEAAIGYNAYSILKTARDEHGNFLPLIFKSFGDWKMGLYVYLSLPFIFIFGLNETSLRLSSAISGVFSVWLFYLLGYKLFSSKTIAFFSAFFCAISPVFVVFSRGAWEVNITITLTLAGIYFFLLAIEGKHKAFILSSIFFGLTFISSHGAKFSTPVILILLIIIFFKDFKKISKPFILTGFLMIFLFVYPVLLSFYEGKVSRITTLSIFSYPSGGEEPFFYYTKAILSRWFGVYSFRSLFFRGDLNPQHTAPDIGPFLLMDAVFLLFGFIRLIRLSFTKKTLFILSTLFLLALPSALTIEKVNFERALTLFIPFIIIEAIGVSFFWFKYKQKSWLLILVIFLYVTNFVYFLDQYLIHNPKKNEAWQYGYKQIVEKVNPIQGRYRHVFVQQSLEQPYIFFLFYQKYDPQKYQKIAGDIFIPNKEGKDMGVVKGFDNINFVDISWKDRFESEVLYVMPKHVFDKESQFNSSYKEIDTVYDLNGFPLFKIVETL